MSYYGYFTNDAKKVIKDAFKNGTLQTEVSENGRIYVVTGAMLFCFSEYDYNEIARPVCCCDPGTFKFSKNGRTDAEPGKWSKFVEDSEVAADSDEYGPAQVFPALFDSKGTGKCGQTERGALAALYRPDNGNVEMIQDRYFSTVLSGLEIRMNGGTKPVYITIDNSLLALILPVRDADIVRRAAAVRAYFADDNN